MRKRLIGMLIVAMVLVFASGAIAGQIGMEFQAGMKGDAVTDIGLGLRLNRFLIPGFTIGIGEDSRIEPKLGVELGMLRGGYHFKYGAWSAGLHLGPLAIDYLMPEDMFLVGIAIDFGKKQEPIGLREMDLGLVDEVADWLMLAVRPSGVWDLSKGGAVGIGVVIWDGDVLDGILGEIPDTNRYYAGIEYPLENLNILESKLDSLSIGAGFSTEADLSDVGGIMWMSYILK